MAEHDQEVMDALVRCVARLAAIINEYGSPGMKRMCEEAVRDAQAEIQERTPPRP